ncbi:polysaccharide biosynthesis/export family protein [Seonamhaeicola aphaedonensis]|uniref:Protein involved in gliding motility EpsA n=1 Tax=Seonamhaeicola aphaedonensis TaxID=1461338 RepID=A0A3D9HFX9_9FLAO|nr:polysaccharide biosynthesis/export family protein [Seonamhaeicola aphaedonensis]RED48387.1 protein involved in gliding motility EpsA [Seonamhaeicola aphaedonensis]
MKRTFFLVLVVINTAFFSCIPYKDTVYLQNKSQATDSIQKIVEQQKPYRVQINDILNIRIKVTDQDNVQIFNPIGIGNLNASGAERAYFDGFTVDLHGNIRIPELGDMNVLGYTATEIETLITDKLLADQFKETANIFVTVKLTGLRYTTYGEIGSGMQTIYQERVNIFEAIANAGDITDVGNKKDVLIIRQYPEGQKIHHIDLTHVNVMNSPYYYIQPNDMIYVKPLKQKSWGTGTNVLQNIGAVATVLSLITTTILVFQRI